MNEPASPFVTFVLFVVAKKQQNEFHVWSQFRAGHQFRCLRAP